jgi:hypothetical protein
MKQMSFMRVNKPTVGKGKLRRRKPETCQTQPDRHVLTTVSHLKAGSGKGGFEQQMSWWGGGDLDKWQVCRFLLVT